MLFRSREQPIEWRIWVNAAGAARRRHVRLKERRGREEVPVCLKCLVRERTPAEELQDGRLRKRRPNGQNFPGVAKHAVAQPFEK